MSGCDPGAACWYWCGSFCPCKCHRPSVAQEVMSHKAFWRSVAFAVVSIAAGCLLLYVGYFYGGSPK